MVLARAEWTRNPDESLASKDHLSASWETLSAISALSINAKNPSKLAYHRYRSRCVRASERERGSAILRLAVAATRRRALSDALLLALRFLATRPCVDQKPRRIACLLNRGCFARLKAALNAAGRTRLLGRGCYGRSTLPMCEKIGPSLRSEY
jgi:hypothetical protein